MSNLQEAINIALIAHKNQTRKNGTPYILHPLRVMLKQTSEKSMTAAVLHDVIEDSEITLNDLKNYGFNDEIIEIVRLLTHVKNQSYDEYIQNIIKNPIAVKIKIADLEDNMNLEELPEITENDLKRMQKYKNALLSLKQSDNNKINKIL